MQTHDTPSSNLQPKTGTPKANPLVSRSFEATDLGQAHAVSPTNPFARCPHEVYMGEHVFRSPVASPEAKTEPDSPPAEQAGYLPFSLHAPGQPPPPLPWWHHTQAKLTIGQPNDPYEQEADAVAEQVMTMPDPDAQVQRQETVEGEAEEAESTEADVQPKLLGDVSPSAVQRQSEGTTTETGMCRQPFQLQAPDRPSPPALPWWGTQAKLTIGQPNDVYEQEADQIAERVMSMAPPATPNVQRQVEEEPEASQTKPLAETITPLVQRQELEDEEPLQAKYETCEQEEPIQRAADGVPQPQPNLENRLNASQGGGSALPDEVRSFMEPRFGADFSQVRVHTDSEAVQMNRDLNAQAFAHKQDLYFGSGKSPANDALTAHELTHVVQQTNGVQNKPNVQRNLFGDERTEREKIDAALKSKDPGDVKAIKDINRATEPEKLELIRVLAYQGWVDPLDESKIEEIWGSFGDQIPRIAHKEIVMWQHCTNVGADLDKLQEVKRLRDKFESDVKDKAAEYLNKNKEYVLQEMQSLGVLNMCIDGQKPPTKEEQKSRLKEIQEVAATVARAQEQVKQLRQIQVGYQLQMGSTMGPDPIPTAYTVPLYFDPDNPPQEQSGLTDEDIRNNKGRRWKEVYEKWKTPAGVITKAANLYPAIYAAIQESQPGVFSDPGDKVASIADEKNPEVARKTIADVLSATKTKIDESIQILPNGKPAYYKLDPIHRQFLAGLPSKSATDWSGNNFNKWVANQDLKEHKERDYWIDIGLKTAAAAAFIAIEIATAGSATFFIAAGIGLAATGANAAMDWSNYVELARVSKTNVKDNTALVDRKQVIEAEAKALESTAEFIAMCAAVGVKGVSGLKRKAPDPDHTKLSQPGGLKATEGQQIPNKKGKLGAPSHPLTEHGPDVDPAHIKQRVIDGKPTATKFTDRAKMETAIGNTIDAKQAEIDAWLKMNPPAGANKPFTNSPKLGNLGEGYHKTSAGTVEKIPGTLENVTVVLKSDGQGSYILQTAFPTK